MTDARAAAATTGLLLLLVALTALAVAPAHVNHDAAWYLYVVRHWLDGATLYRDVVDTNPPLIIWLSTPAVWIAALTGSPATALFKAFVFAVAAASLLIVRDLVRRTWPDREFVIVAGCRLRDTAVRQGGLRSARAPGRLADAAVRCCCGDAHGSLPTGSMA